MDAQERGEHVGSNIARTVHEWTARNVFALQFGYGMPKINMFTGEKMRPIISEQVINLHQALVARGLNLDHEFMAIAASAIEEIARQPLDVLLGDLASAEEIGDGGPGFRVSGDRGEELSAAAMLDAFVAADRTELRKKLLAKWPRNQTGQAACPCCGYFTLIDAPMSEESCPVCHWYDTCDLQDAWNTTRWGNYEWDEPEDDEDEETKWIDIQTARTNFEQFGASRKRYLENVRSQQPDELPRYDWSKDRRPHAGPPWKPSSQ